jgi:hypothetical protein
MERFSIYQFRRVACLPQRFGTTAGADILNGGEISITNASTSAANAFSDLSLTADGAHGAGKLQQILEGLRL